MSLTAEKRAAKDVIYRAFDRGLYAQVFYEDGARATPITQDSRRIFAELQATGMETVIFLRREDRLDPRDERFQRVGFVTFVWGNSPDEVVADYSDNELTAELVTPDDGKAR